MEIMASRSDAAIRPIWKPLGLMIPKGIDGSASAANPSAGFIAAPPGSPISPSFRDVYEAGKTFTMETIDIAELDKSGILRNAFGLKAGAFAISGDLDALFSPGANKVVGSINLLDAALDAVPGENLTATGISAVLGGAVYFANLANGKLSVMDKRFGWVRPLFEIASVAAAVSGSPAAAQNLHSAGQIVGVLVSLGKFAHTLYEVSVRPSPSPAASTLRPSLFVAVPGAPVYTFRQSGLSGSTKWAVIGPMPQMAITAGSLPSGFTPS
jgi:hypothetical protein